EVVDQNTNTPYWRATEKGFYAISATGTLKNRIFRQFGSGEFKCKIGYALNRMGDWQTLNYPDVITIAEANGFDELVSFNLADNIILQLDQNDDVALFYIGEDATGTIIDKSEIDVQFTINKVDQTFIEQKEFFKGLTPKDFYREIMWRFGLTPFPSK